jgi:hypothetical protein
MISLAFPATVSEASPESAAQVFAAVCESKIAAAIANTIIVFRCFIIRLSYHSVTAGYLMTWRTYKEFGPIDQHVVSNRMTSWQDYDF